MVHTVPNPQARGNIQHGRLAFQRGLRGIEEVYRDHLRWNRGAAAEFHFASGYREAAKDAGVDVGDALRFVDPIFPLLSAEEKAQRDAIREARK